MSNMTEQDAVVAAEKVVADLEAKRRVLIERGREIAATRHGLSYDATVEANPKSVKALAALALDAADVGREMETLVSAIEEAERRLSIAQAAQSQQGDRDNALAIREVLAEFTECALSLDEALAALGEEGAALFAAVNKLHALGCTVPSDTQVRVLGLQCLQTALMATPWHKEFPHLPPRERRSWAALARTWAAAVEANVIRPHLGEAESETKEHEVA